jgi:hypothetical protein
LINGSDVREKHHGCNKNHRFLGISHKGKYGRQKDAGTDAKPTLEDPRQKSHNDYETGKQAHEEKTLTLSSETK